MIPIWQTYLYSIDTSESGGSVVYSIEDESGNTLYTGRAYAAPDDTYAYVKLNEICSNYLDNPFPVTEDDIYDENQTGGLRGSDYGMVKKFTVVAGDTRNQVQFYWDYSYDKDTDDYDNRSIPFNINDHATEGMYVMDSVLVEEEEVASLDSEWTRVPEQFRFYGFKTGYCGDYAIYYLNRYGGWSSYLVEGRVKQVDDYNTASYQKRMENNTNPVARSETRYNNEITPRWEIKTGWLNDRSSQMLATHLLSSNDVWLHDLKKDTLIPVIITDNSVEYKTYNNERRLFGYTLNVKAANKMVIK